MACIAARLMSSGAGKSGKPCERFTAPYFIASRVISRMTDSVNCEALRETRPDVVGAGELMTKTNQPQMDTDLHRFRQKRTLSETLAIISLALICVYPCSSVAFSSAV